MIGEVVLAVLIAIVLWGMLMVIIVAPFSGQESSSSYRSDSSTRTTSNVTIGQINVTNINIGGGGVAALDDARMYLDSIGIRLPHRELTGSEIQQVMIAMRNGDRAELAHIQRRALAAGSTEV